MRNLVRVAVVAVLLGAPVAPALANGPGGGCHVYYHDPVVYGVPGTPYLFCDY